MNKPLTYAELQQLALRHYNDGGSIVYECWGEKDFDEMMKLYGPMDEAKALQIFEGFKEHNPGLFSSDKE